MQTIRLYDQDAYLRQFTAQVLTCEAGAGGWLVELDRTAFYPEGGGQPSDRGTLGGAAVLDVQERGGRIFHLCSAPLEPGTAAEGCIDWARRFDLMQQHSGEHLVSGAVHARFGWNNVGFHMGSEFITIDFDGPIPPEALPELEAQVNGWVWQNIPSETLLPTAQELPELAYRSKKALTGQVRIVRFGDADSCACCGTHVRSTGEIGLVKLFSCVKFHSGVRIELLCGRRALAYLTELSLQNQQVSQLLSAKPLQTAQAVRRLLDERGALQERLAAMERAQIARKAQALAGTGDVLLFEPELSSDGVRRLATAVMETCGGRCAVFSGSDGAGYHYALGQPDADLRPLVRQLNEALQGRGGGKPFFAQGSVRASQAQIEAFFAALP